jgi:hypothetical protein
MSTANRSRTFWRTASAPQWVIQPIDLRESAPPRGCSAGAADAWTITDSGSEVHDC